MLQAGWYSFCYCNVLGRQMPPFFLSSVSNRDYMKQRRVKGGAATVFQGPTVANRFPLLSSGSLIGCASKGKTGVPTMKEKDEGKDRVITVFLNAVYSLWLLCLGRVQTVKRLPRGTERG